jgi:hypothetical protein
MSSTTTYVIPLLPGTCTGELRLIIVPSPSLPQLLIPQDHKVPSVFLASE